MIEEFILDLREAVCMLQNDGIHMSFVHRSFQEYFTAVFVTNIETPKLRRAMDKFVMRFTDNVVLMSFDMARDAIERDWILPNISEIVEALEVAGATDSPAASRAKLLFGQLHFGRFGLNGEHIMMPFLDPEHPQLHFLARARLLYPGELANVFDVLYNTSAESISKILQKNPSKRLFRATELRGILRFASSLDQSPENKKSSREIKSIQIDIRDDWWLRELKIDKFFEELLGSLRSVKRDIEKRNRENSEIIGFFM